ncbi:ATP-binding protein [Intrasporangium sp. DVR]|uniref:sensor histidine kinase n=1 Tax=Intrasporangium sp. DVR TaxID=3127867 RepID=UPI00313A5378
MRPGPPATALAAGGWLVGLVVTALVIWSPYLWSAYQSPSLDLILDTADACIALLVAYLLYGRFMRSRRAQDLLLASGLLLLAVAGLGMSLVLQLLEGYQPDTFDVWLPVGLRTVGALLLGLAAFTGDRSASAGWARRALWAPWVLIGLAFAVLWGIRDVLPVAITEHTAEALTRPHLTGHPVLLVAYALAAACFFIGSVIFTVQEDRRNPGHRDALLRVVGPAFALAGFARINYMLFPSLDSGWLYTGDVLRTAFYSVLHLGAGREIRQYWSAQARAAVLEDRRRLARELHDGVLQELGYIRMEAHSIGDSAVKGDILASCDRALDEARTAVDALGSGPEEPLSVLLQRAARQVAERYNAAVEVDLDDSVAAAAEHTHALVRITREAVSNAIRHGGVARVTLRLSAGERGLRQLTVSDAGRGFDPHSMVGAAKGYGLKSMSERAQALGGSFDIHSSIGEGTTVAVTW